MYKSLVCVVLTVVACHGDHPTPILDAIINGATHIKSSIQETSSLLGKLTHQGGLFNIGGSFGFNKNPGPQYSSPPHGYGPGPYDYRPGPGPYGPPGPRPYGPPYGPPGNNQPNGPGYGYGPNSNGQYNNNNNGLNYGQNNYNCDQNHQNPVDNTQQENKPNYNDGNSNKKPIEGQTTHGSTTEDVPIHVPLLNPNEVNYGGNKDDNNNSPKRETKNDEADDDQEYNIDIRFNKDQ